MAYRAFSSGLGDSVSSREFCRDYIFAKPTQNKRTSVLEDKEKQLSCHFEMIFSTPKSGEC